MSQSDPQVADVAEEILENLLTKLGFDASISQEDSQGVTILQVDTDDARTLIGPRGERLEDLQYLVNRMLFSRLGPVQRVQVDVDRHRARRDDRFIEKMQGLADRVRETGRPLELRPMNSYLRRLVHNTFVDDPEIQAVSGDARPDAKTKPMRLELRN